MSAELPVIAVVGRPNVGKSTLVNRLTGTREAIVEDTPGVTRDRKEVLGEWNGRRFIAMDTGGWMPKGSALDDQVSEQALRALKGADVVLFVVDVTLGVSDDDEKFARLLRKLDVPVRVVTNKVDGGNRDYMAWEFASLGLGDPWPISAIHGRGAGDLLDHVLDLFPPQPESMFDDETDAEEGTDDEVVAAKKRAAHRPAPDERDATVDFSVAIVGRPNVGKSTLFNRLVGEDRSVVHDMAGTTRDSIDTVVDTPDGRVRFVDTAGLRRRAKEAQGAEYYSLVRALQSIDRADLALLVIDATEGVTHQDQRLAERIDAAGSPIAIVLNKWELVDTETRPKVLEQVADMLGFLTYAPVLKISALSGMGVHKLLPALGQAVEAYQSRVPTAVLNRVVMAAQSAHPAPGGIKIKYATQGATNPPTFTLFANREIPQPYLRYIERKLREHFDFGPTPVKLRVRL